MHGQKAFGLMFNFQLFIAGGSQTAVQADAQHHVQHHAAAPAARHVMMNLKSIICLPMQIKLLLDSLISFMQ